MKDELRRAVAIRLYKTGCIKWTSDGSGFWTMKTHQANPLQPRSPYYCNLKRIRSYPRTLGSIVGSYVLATLDMKLDFQLLADVPIGATPIVVLMSRSLNVPMISPRKRKDYGTGALIEGVYKPGQKVLLVDDVATGGNSLLESLSALTSADLVVEDALVLIDRQQGGKERLANSGIKLHSIFQIEEIFRLYTQMGFLSANLEQKFREYREAVQ